MHWADIAGNVSHARRFRRVAVIAGALAIAGCFRDSTGPHGGRSAFFSVAPSFSSHAARIVAFDHVRIVLYRASGAVAIDTVVAFPDTAEEISLSLRVELADPSGPQ